MVSTISFEDVFSSVIDSIIICDLAGKIVRMNTAALQLFHISSEEMLLETDYQQLFQHYKLYELYDEQQCPVSFSSWFKDVIAGRRDATHPYERIIVLSVPSEEKHYFSAYCSPVVHLEEHARQVTSIVFILHVIGRLGQRALKLQSVYDAVSHLKDTIANLPDYVQLAQPGVTLLLSPAVIFVSQQLVNMIHHVVDCDRVALQALGPPDEHLYYVAGSGLAVAQEHYLRKMGGLIRPSEYIDEASLARLHDHQEVVLPSNRLRRPLVSSSVSDETILLYPLFVAHRFAGAVVLSKVGADSVYTPEEIELIKAVTAETDLAISCIHYLQHQAQSQTKELILQEVNHITTDFLTLASHELFTPLTGVIGNLQLAQRRLEHLKQQVVLPEQVGKQIEDIEQSVKSANRSAQIQQHIINDLIDDARIKSHSLVLVKQSCDLLALLNEAVAEQRRLSPERTILLENLLHEQAVTIIADPERIAQILCAYLKTIFGLAPIKPPIIVQLSVKKNVSAMVSMREEGTDLSQEDQHHLLENFYAVKRDSVLDEKNIDLGLSFYLAQELVKIHGGTVGIQGMPGHGASLWFSLPLAEAPNSSAH
jgi:signal transduction histidine kinase